MTPLNQSHRAIVVRSPQPFGLPFVPLKAFKLSFVPLKAFGLPFVPPNLSGSYLFAPLNLSEYHLSPSKTFGLPFVPLKAFGFPFVPPNLSGSYLPKSVTVKRTTTTSPRDFPPPPRGCNRFTGALYKGQGRRSVAGGNFKFFFSVMGVALRPLVRSKCHESMADAPA